MECILLGSGGMMPMPYRLLTSLAVRCHGRVYLFDAGEGTQLGFKKARIGVRALGVLAVSHLHADHCLGIPGILMLKAQMRDPEPLTIIGPKGIEKFIRQTHENLGFYLNFPITFIEWSSQHGEAAYEDAQVRILWHPVEHSRFCLGYRLEELDRPGKFNTGKARKLGIPQGPLWGKLQQGQPVNLENGEEITPERVLGEPRRGRHVAYVVDTRPAKGIYYLCKNSDIVFIEGMFLPDDANHADTKGHLTVVDAARIASRAGARRAVLVHISPRYDDDDLHLLAAAAKSRFNEAEMGQDFKVYHVELPDEA
ncbi:MAG: ribonuclease Z [Deltaproteobacteria bacterium]|nr:MAG: ribonuclease Z [Deltaproteobacteria bacterium]